MPDHNLDIRHFFQATNPSRTLNIQDPVDRQLYVDFSEVRGGQIIEEMKANITFFSPDEPTCTLFTGHIGCGKSTELLRLKQELEAEAFHVVYFESSDDLEIGDVDIGDVMLAIARRISQSLEFLTLPEQTGLRALLRGAAKVLTTDIELLSAELGGELPGLKEFGASWKNDGEFALSAGIAKITARAKNDVHLRDRLNNYLGPQKNQLLDLINQELIEPGIALLKAQGQAGLVVIVDNLDRIDNRPKSHGRPQQEYLFIDQSDCLKGLRCHTVYTLPLALKFSNEYATLTQRFLDDPKVLPMVPIQFQDGTPCDDGMTLLQQMVLTRALPQSSAAQQQAIISQVFDHPDSLDHLCRMSGGHVRDLLRILNAWIRKVGRNFPLTRDRLEEVLRGYRNEITMYISDEEWALLRQVRQRQKVSGDDDYQKLIRSRLVFEYRDRGQSWFDVNPILLDAPELD
ncbi:MAG: ATP-binding protein [Cyanobacteria bacterium P01_A01_bin.135]